MFRRYFSSQSYFFSAVRGLFLSFWAAARRENNKKASFFSDGLEMLILLLTDGELR